MTKPPTPWSSDQPTSRGACPGVAAPMASGDGLLLRVRHPIGGLSATQARAIAAVAEGYGNGQLELTSRGNLQLRGVRDAALPDAQQALIQAGVADADPEREAVRNVLAAPASDLDPTAVMDVTAVARVAAEAVAGAPRLRALPPKTGVVVDGGGTAGIPDVAADVRLDATTRGDGIGYRVALAGRAATAAPVGWISPAHVADAVTAVLAPLAAGATPRRMATALAEWGEAPFRQALSPWCDDRVPPSPVISPEVTVPTGLDASGAWIQAVFPFGALDAGQLRALAAVVDQYAASGSLRLTPWRSVLVTGVGAAAVAALSELGAVTDAADPRRWLGACVGAPACASGSTPTRDQALALEPLAPALLAAGERLHVSGCGKGCGAVAQAAVMLVAADGAYAMTLAGGVQHAPDWPPAPWTTVRRRIAALDALFARETQPTGETLDQLITRLGRTAVVRRVEEEARRV